MEQRARLNRIQKKNDAAKKKGGSEGERGRAKRKNKRQSGSRERKRRGTRANQIALICCASSKNVNARRPLVIQPWRGLLSFPSILARFSVSLRSPFHPLSPSFAFTRYTRWLLSAVLCSALRFCRDDFFHLGVGGGIQGLEKPRRVSLALRTS